MKNRKSLKHIKIENRKRKGLLSLPGHLLLIVKLANWQITDVKVGRYFNRKWNCNDRLNSIRGFKSATLEIWLKNGDKLFLLRQDLLITIYSKLLRPGQKQCEIFWKVFQEIENAMIERISQLPPQRHKFN